MDPLDEIVVRVPLIEPAGGVLEFSGRMLCENTLLIGNAGSGKTGTLNHFLQQAIQYKADDPQRKVGLFVYDSKADGTTERVLHWAVDADRAADVVVLSENSLFGYDPFFGATRFADLERVVAKFSASDPGKHDNDFFWCRTRDSMIEAALTLHLVLQGKLELAPTLQWLARLLLSNAPIGNADREVVAAFAEIFSGIRSRIDPHVATKLEVTIQTLEIWNKLDHRTRGILTACIGNILEPWMSFSASPFLCGKNRPAACISDIIEQGKILVLKINAAERPHLAAVLGRMLKSDLYGAIQRRQPATKSFDRFVGLFFDEYPLVATGNRPLFGDLQNLQTMREKRAFMVAATQGYISMANAIGRAEWEGIKVNFSNFIYLRSHEAEVEDHARSLFGVGIQESSISVRIDARDEGPAGQMGARRHQRTMRTESESWVVRLGALSRLEPHQAFVANGRGERMTCWLDPLHLSVSPSSHGLGDNIVTEAQELIRRALRKATRKRTAVDLAKGVSVLREKSGILTSMFFSSPTCELTSKDLPTLADVMLNVLTACAFRRKREWHEIQLSVGEMIDQDQCDGIRSLPGYDCVVGVEEIPQRSYRQLGKVLMRHARKNSCPPPAILSYYRGIPIVIFAPGWIDGDHAEKVMKGLIALVSAFSPQLLAQDNK